MDKAQFLATYNVNETALAEAGLCCGELASI